MTIRNLIGGLALALLAACSVSPVPQHGVPAPSITHTATEPARPSDFDHLVTYVFISEGYVYENVPGDPGGPTKFGVTIGDVRRYLKPNATAADVKALTIAQAKEIYDLHYWRPIGDGNLAPGVNYSIFDEAVNAGVGRATGDSRHCAAAGSNVDQINCLYHRRLDFQMGLPARYNKFKKGWRNRIVAVHNMSLQMAGVHLDKAALGTDLFLIPRIGRGKAIRD